MDPLSFSNAISTVAQRVGTSDPGSVQESAQIDVLQKANQVQAQSALALITGVGSKLDVHG